MRRSRHVVLSVRSWQYIGLLVMSLACLTFGFISRSREGRHESLAGPELVHTAVHELDFYPNDDQVSYLLSTDSSLSFSKLALTVSVAKVIPSKNRDFLKLVRSIRINNESQLSPTHSDVTRLISNQIYDHPLREPIVHRIRTQFMNRQVIYERQIQRAKASKYRNTGLRRQFEDRIFSRILVTYKQRDIRNSYIDKFKQNHQVEYSLAVGNRRVDASKTRFFREYYDSNFKQRSIINSESRKRQEIRKNLVRKLHEENQMDFQTYSNLKSEYRKIGDLQNQLDFQVKYKIINEEERVRLIKNALYFRADHKLVNTRYQVRDVTNQHDFRVKDQRRVIIIEKYHIPNFERQAHNSWTERKSINQKRLNKAVENGWTHEFRLLSRKHDETFRIENERVRSNKHVQAREYKREILRLQSQRSRLLKHILENRKNTFKLNSRNVRTRISRMKNSQKGREISQLKNHLLLMKQFNTRKNHLISKILKKISEINHRSSVIQVIRKLYESRLSNDLKTKETQKNNKIIEKIQFYKNQLESKRNKQFILMFTTRKNEWKNLLPEHRGRDPVSQKWSQNTKHKYQYVIRFLDQYQSSENRLDEAQNERKIERFATMFSEQLNLKNNLIHFVKIKTTSMDLQYLKTIIVGNNLDYEILRQGIIIALCAIYGASIFNSKTALVRNVVQYISQISIL